MKGGNDKTHDTALRMLELLKIMLNETLSRKNIIKDLKDNGTADRFYTPEALLKYFNTFEAAGLKTEKIKTKYELKNGFYKLNLTTREENALKDILNNYPKLHEKNAEYILEKIVKRLDKYTDIDLAGEFEKIVERNRENNLKLMKNNLLNTLEKYKYDGQKVKITFLKSGKEEEINCEIKDINDIKGNIICYVSEIQKNKKIRINSIIKMEQSPQKSNGISLLNSVVFEVSGRLAGSYRIKPSEVAVNFEGDTMVISNREEDNDSILLRLFKYGENCKITKPKSLIKDYLALADKIIYNLENH